MSAQKYIPLLRDRWEEQIPLPRSLWGGERTGFHDITIPLPPDKQGQGAAPVAQARGVCSAVAWQVQASGE